MKDLEIRNLKATTSIIEITDDKEPGLQLRVFKNGKKKFRYRITVKGKSHSATLGEYPKLSLKDARLMLQDVKKKFRDESNGLDTAPIYNFGNLIEEYFSFKLPTFKKKYKDECTRIINKELMPVLETKVLSEIQRRDVNQIIDKIWQRNSIRMGNKTLQLMKSLFNFGIERGLMNSNPAQHIKKNPKGEIKRERYYSDDEIVQIWNVVKTLPEPTKCYYALLFLYGQRKDETLRIKWVDVNEEDKIWEIPASITKNSTRQVLPLTPYFELILKGLKKSTKKPTEYLFASQVRSRAPFSPKLSAKEIKQKTGISDFRIHDIRRTFATNLSKLGYDRLIIGKLLNHKDMAGDNHVTAIYDRNDYMKEKNEALLAWQKKLKSILKDGAIGEIKLINEYLIG